MNLYILPAFTRTKQLMFPLTLLVISGLAATGHAQTADASGNLATVTIGTTKGSMIASSFLGVSQEWGDAQSTMGDSLNGTNLIYRQLLANLSAYGSGPAEIRIGGDSTDRTGEPTSTTVKAFSELVEASGARFTLGVNLGSNNVDLAAAQAKAYFSQMPGGSIKAIEIGNEPDEYYKNGMRASNYTIDDYYDDFNKWKDKIMPELPGGVKLLGASWAFLGTAENYTNPFLSKQSDNLTFFSTHCYGASPKNNPSAAFFLTPGASTAVPKQLASSISTTHAHGLKFRLGETGPISDGGVAGVSNSFAAALWTIDNMFESAKAGIDGLNLIIGTGDHNAPFVFNIENAHGKNTYSLNTVNPIYYGMLLFQQAIEGGVHMLPVTLTTKANLKAWAMAPFTGTPRLVVINKDTAASGTVVATMRGYNVAKVYRLSAPSYKSTSGVTLAGQTFVGSHNGKPVGSEDEETINGNDGVFHVSVGETSAALVVFSK